ncbi:MAG TPA: hypothetical protein VN704_12635 [Verrucomicrobiae bacterium]|nr:hypothetical protein [Verrucomicrobiae bacterium]
MNRITNLLVLLILISFILPATAIKHVDESEEDNSSSSIGSTDNNNAVSSGDTIENNKAATTDDSTNNNNAVSSVGSTENNSNENTQQQSGDFVKTILDIHNRERAAVSVPPIVWNDILTADTKTYA